MNRREFISISSKVTCACVLGATSAGLNSCTSTTSSELEDTTGVEMEFDLSSSEYVVLKQDGGSIVTEGNEIDSNGLLLLNTNDEIKAFTRRCTHQGIQLNAFSNGLSTCTNGHGAQFDTNGVVVSGPAIDSLKMYDTDLDGNTLTVFGS